MAWYNPYGRSIIIEVISLPVKQVGKIDASDHPFASEDANGVIGW
jgi:hypothetical protein